MNNNPTERDLLIEVKTKIDLFHDAFLKHVDEAGGRFKTVENAIKQAHRRVDVFTAIGLLTIIGFIITMIVIR